jgi:hypothetical protein
MLSGKLRDDCRGLWDCEFDGDQEAAEDALLPLLPSLFFPSECASLRRDIGALAINVDEAKLARRSRVLGGAPVK